jgi:hypothetical protein
MSWLEVVKHLRQHAVSYQDANKGKAVVQHYANQLLSIERDLGLSTDEGEWQNLLDEEFVDQLHRQLA